MFLIFPILPDSYKYLHLILVKIRITYLWNSDQIKNNCIIRDNQVDKPYKESQFYFTLLILYIYEFIWLNENDDHIWCFERFHNKSK